MTVITRKITVKGRVQGVCYRAFARDTALKIGARGTVRNLPNGSVEVVFQGKEEMLPSFLRYLEQGSQWSRVEGVEVEPAEFDKTYNSFSVIY